MARMYGKTKYTFFNSCRRGCCYIDIDKKAIKRQEEQQWQQELDEELTGDDYYHWQMKGQS